MKLKPSLKLTALIILTCAIMSIAGVLTQLTVGKASAQIQDSLPLTVPLLIMRDPAIIVSPAAAHSSAEIPPCSLPTVLLAAASRPEQPTAGAPQLHPVAESYFDDALFIGDSRTEGLAQYGRLGQADYFAASGMTVFNVLTAAAADINFASTDLPSLLAGKQYGKIYIMLGINELGYELTSIIEQYREVIDHIRQAQPAAQIILCANIYVTAEKAAAVSWLSKDNISRLNNSIARLADNINIFYLDVNELFLNDNGYLDESMTGDGVHPYATGYQAWASWLQEHGL